MNIFTEPGVLMPFEEGWGEGLLEYGRNLLVYLGIVVANFLVFALFYMAAKSPLGSIAATCIVVMLLQLRYYAREREMMIRNLNSEHSRTRETLAEIIRTPELRYSAVRWQNWLFHKEENEGFSLRQRMMLTSILWDFLHIVKARKQRETDPETLQVLREIEFAMERAREKLTFDTPIKFEKHEK